jgi:DNA repair protein RadD
MLPSLRPYQEHDLGAVRIHFRTHQRVLLVQPTGAGKGRIASYAVQAASEGGHRVMFLVNRRNLVHDMSNRVTSLGIPHGVIMGDDKRYDPAQLVQVASIDTVARRAEKPPAALLIVDEAHFAVTDTWASVLGSYPGAKILGMTATPIRTDGRGLGELFEVMVQGPSVKALIAQGYLVPAVLFRPAGAPKLDAVPKVGGDFNKKQLAAISDTPKLVGDIVKQWKRIASDRKTAAYCVDKKHALNTAEQFRMEGIDFAYIDCDTPDRERDRIWQDFDHGRLRGVTSVGTISYGWDHPICSCIIGARATASVGLWRQILGRGARPYPGKKEFLVLDHFDNTGRLNALYEDDVEWSLEGEAIKKKATDNISITTCRQCFATFRSGPQACPYCLVPLPKHQQKIRTVAGELERQEDIADQKRAAIERWRKSQTPELRRAKFEELWRTCRARRYKPSWVFRQYEVLFHEPVPLQWRAPT